MKSCGYGDCICIGIYCEKHLTPCKRCKKPVRTADLWSDGYCDDCHMEVNYGEQVTEEEQDFVEN